MFKSSLFHILITVILFGGLSSCQKPDTRLQADLEYKIDSQLGEGAFWNHRSGELYWIDIEGRKFHRYDPAARTIRTYDTPSRAGTVVAETDTTAILALEDGVYRLNLETGVFSLFVPIEEDIPTNRFNDGKCDPNGNLWVGSMRLDESIPAGYLYRVTPTGDSQRMLSGITISNGIVWSSDRKTLYYIDTPTGQIRAYDFNTGDSSISNERVAVVVDEKDGYPDGMAIDENDHLWVGLWNGNAVGCYDPDSGELLRKIAVPAHNVTSCAFGGDQLDILYITTASVDMTPEEQQQFPLAGSLFTVKPGVRGVKSEFFGN